MARPLTRRYYPGEPEYAKYNGKKFGKHAESVNYNGTQVYCTHNLVPGCTIYISYISKDEWVGYEKHLKDIVFYKDLSLMQKIKVYFGYDYE